MDSGSTLILVAVIGGLFALGGPALEWHLRRRDALARPEQGTPTSVPVFRSAIPVLAYLGVAATLLAGLFFLSNLSAKPVAQTSQGVATNPIVLVEGTELAKFVVGDTIRVQAAAPPGNSVSVKTDGPVTLIAQRSVTKLINGRPDLGALAREFEVRADELGQAKIILTFEDARQNPTGKREIPLEIVPK